MSNPRPWGCWRVGWPRPKSWAGTLPPPPPETAMGALITHITGGAEAKTFQPMNVNFGLFPPIDAKGGRRGRTDRYKAYTDRAKAGLPDMAFVTRFAPSRRPAPCIWAMPIPPCWPMTWPGPKADTSFFGLKTSTKPAVEAEWEAIIYDDLQWLGLSWRRPGPASVGPDASLSRRPWKTFGTARFCCTLHLSTARHQAGPQRPARGRADAWAGRVRLSRHLSRLASTGQSASCGMTIPSDWMSSGRSTVCRRLAFWKPACAPGRHP